jgi:hypothetical protein
MSRKQRPKTGALHEGSGNEGRGGQRRYRRLPIPLAPKANRLVCRPISEDDLHCLHSAVTSREGSVAGREKLAEAVDAACPEDVDRISRPALGVGVIASQRDLKNATNGLFGS